MAFQSEEPWGKALYAGGDGAVEAGLQFLHDFCAWRLKHKEGTPPIGCHIYTSLQLYLASLPQKHWHVDHCGSTANSPSGLLLQMPAFLYSDVSSPT